MKRIALAAAVAALAASLPAAADVSLHEFKAGERARAADVNGNFSNLKAAIDAALKDNDALKSQVKDLQAALATVISLKDTLTVETINGVRTVRLTGVNLQVVNGTNNTELVNGAGNIIIGYDEPNTELKIACSLATDVNGNSLTAAGPCLAAGGSVVTRQKTGSHNLVMGSQNSYSSAGGIVAGQGNFITALYASNLGGNANVASGKAAVNVAGQGNHPTDVNDAILGGANNTASSNNSTVAGGSSNKSSFVGSTVSGGFRNTASGAQSNVSGGIVNESSGAFSHVGGGSNNNSSGVSSTIAGGSQNDSQAPTSSISGGSRNVTTVAVQVLP
jgi:hypothetical protein